MCCREAFKCRKPTCAFKRARTRTAGKHTHAQHTNLSDAARVSCCARVRGPFSQSSFKTFFIPPANPPSPPAPLTPPHVPPASMIQHSSNQSSATGGATSGRGEPFGRGSTSRIVTRPSSSWLAAALNGGATHLFTVLSTAGSQGPRLQRCSVLGRHFFGEMHNCRSVFRATVCSSV